MNDIQAFMLEKATRPTFRDLFSYKSRATKRLLKRLIRLADAFGENELVSKNANTLEVWFACIAPVMQGYWRSPVSKQMKEEVIDEFYRHAFNIVINDVVIPSPKFQALDAAGQDQLIAMMYVDIQKQFKRRANEYVDAIVAYA